MTYFSADADSENVGDEFARLTCQISCKLPDLKDPESTSELKFDLIELSFDFGINENIIEESSERSGNGHHQGNDISRFMSSTKGSNLGSDHGMDDHRSYHSRGGKRLPDQKDKLEPETDELAESGYYTISPRKDSFLRDCYLTKSQSIDMTSLDGLPVRRRWSSSQSDSQEESWIEERSSERSGSESDLNVSVNDDVRGHREWRDHSNSFTSSLTGKTLTMRRPSSQNTVNDSEDGSNIQYSNRSRSRSGSGSRRPSGSATRHRSGSDTRNRLGSDSRHRTGDKRQNLCRNPKSTSSPHEDEMYNTNFLTEAVVPDSKRRQYVSPDLSDASPPTFELRDSSYPKSQSHRSASVSSKRSSLPAERQGEKIAVNSVQSSPQRHRSSKSRKQLNSASGMKESSDESVNLTKLNRRKSSDGRNSLQDTNLSPGYQERFTSKSKIKDRERSHKGSRLRPQDLEDNGDEVKLRPLTSESNGDSGFHGSEGTMQSQEQLAHNYMQQVPRVERHWSETISPMRSSGTRFRSSRRSNRHDLGQYENVSIPETASSTVLRDFPRQSKPGLLLDPRSGGNKVRRHREIPVDISPTSTASPEHSQEYYLPHSIVSDTSFDSYRPRSSGEKYRNQMISLREKMSSKRSHSKSRIKDDVEHTPITSRLKASRRRSASLSTLEEMPSTSSRGRSIRAPRSDLYRDSETQTKMQGSKSPESEKSQRSERSSRATDLVRGELQRLRSHLAEEARLKDIHSAITDDLRRRQAELDRDLAKRGLQESQREMYNELKHQIEDLAKKIQGHSKTSESPPNDHQKLYEEVKRKLDTLAKEVRESRKRDAKQDSSRDQGHRTKPSKAKEPPREYHTPEPIYVSSPSTTVIPVCPVCDGVGYHKHGNYVFPRDFLSSKQHVRFVPAPTSLVSPPSAPTLDAASTPIHQVQAAPTDIPVIHSPAVAGYATSTPVHHHLHDANHRSTQPPLYRVIPDRVRSPTVALYPLNATIHHIHTYHRRGKADISSSDESDEDIPRTLSKSQRHRPSRPRFYSSTRTIDELDDWRLNQSLDDASRAARDMQRISKRMLNTIATDLINSSYAEL